MQIINALCFGVLHVIEGVTTVIGDTTIQRNGVLTIAERFKSEPWRNFKPLIIQILIIEVRICQKVTSVANCDTVSEDRVCPDLLTRDFPRSDMTVTHSVIRKDVVTYCTLFKEFITD